MRIAPVLNELAERYGETVHYAVLEGPSIVYRAKADPKVGPVDILVNSASTAAAGS